MATTNAELVPAREVADAPGFELTSVRMCCGKTRYSVVGSLQPGDELRLHDADGRVHASDYNASGAPRPTRLSRILSDHHDLVASLVPQSSMR